MVLLYVRGMSILGNLFAKDGERLRKIGNVCPSTRLIGNVLIWRKNSKIGDIDFLRGLGCSIHTRQNHIIIETHILTVDYVVPTYIVERRTATLIMCLASKYF